MLLTTASMSICVNRFASAEFMPNKAERQILNGTYRTLADMR